MTPLFCRSWHCIVPKRANVHFSAWRNALRARCAKIAGKTRACPRGTAHLREPTGRPRAEKTNGQDFLENIRAVRAAASTRQGMLRASNPVCSHPEGELRQSRTAQRKNRQWDALLARMTAWRHAAFPENLLAGRNRRWINSR